MRERGVLQSVLHRVWMKNGQGKKEECVKKKGEKVGRVVPGYFDKVNDSENRDDA